MKIIESKHSNYVVFCQKYSTDIEYDSIVKYFQKIAEFIEKFFPEKISQKEFDEIYIKACEYADKGITHDGHRRALEILSLYWEYGNFVNKYKI